MWEKFTQHSIVAIMSAQTDASQLGCDHCNAEHILLGLLGQGTGTAARALKKLGLTYRDVRAELVIDLGPNTAPKRWFGFLKTGIKPMPFGEQSKKVFQLSLNSAIEQNENLIDTQHLLFGLINSNESTSIAGSILKKYNLDIERVKQVIYG